MKLIITANTSWNLAHFRAGLISALIKDGHEVIALSPADRGIPALEDMGARFVPINIDHKGLSPRNDARLIKDMRRHFRAERPDAVLSFTVKNNIFGAMAAAPLRIPFLPNVSGLGTAFLGSRILKTLVTGLYRIAFRPLPLVFFQNGDDAELFLNRRIVTPGQVQLLPGSGIDTRKFDPSPLPARKDDEPTFLLVARMLRDKGIAEYVEAAEILRKSHPNARFQLLGEAGSENRTAISADQMADWAEAGNIEYLGAVDDVRPMMANADCIVLPSYREGTPRTLLEGAAMARPLVATDVPGCREVVEEGVTGYLCAVRDAADLARALAAMVDLGQNRRSVMGLAGRRMIEMRFDEGIVIDGYRDALKRAVMPAGISLRADA